MKKIEVTLYKFSELSPEAKKRVLKNYDDMFPLDCQMLTEDFKYILSEEFGICGDIQVYWSLSNCQGDGVAFYGTPDVAKLLDKHQELRGLIQEYPRLDDEAPSLYLQIEHKSSHYNHFNTMDIACYVELVDRSSHPFTCDQLDHKVVSYIKDLFKKACFQLEKIGYETIDSWYSEPTQSENLEELGEIFLESGRIMP